MHRLDYTKNINRTILLESKGVYYWQFIENPKCEEENLKNIYQIGLGSKADINRAFFIPILMLTF